MNPSADDIERGWPEWCARIRIRNTFIDVDEDTAPYASPRRQVSAPILRVDSSSRSPLSVAATSDRVYPQSWRSYSVGDAKEAAPLWLVFRRAAFQASGTSGPRGEHRSSRGMCAAGSLARGRRAGQRQRRESQRRRCASSSVSSGQSSGHSSEKSIGHSCGRSSTKSRASLGAGSVWSARPCGKRSESSSSRGMPVVSSGSAPMPRVVEGPEIVAVDNSLSEESSGGQFCRGTPPVAQWNELGGALGSSVDLDQSLSPEAKSVVHNRIPLSNRFIVFDGGDSDDPEMNVRVYVQDHPPVEATIQEDGFTSQRTLAKRDHSPEDSNLPPVEEEEVASRRSKTKRRSNRRSKNSIGSKGDLNPAGDPAEIAANAGEEKLHVLTQVADFDASVNKARGVRSSLPLSEESASILALMTARMNETLVLRYMRDISIRQIVVAVPVEAIRSIHSDMIDIMLGMVVHCEIVDASLWGCGTVIAPTTVAGRRGCFPLSCMRPIIAEALTNRFGDNLEWTAGGWNMVSKYSAATPQFRLRRKNAQGKINLVRHIFDASGRSL